jgi:putative ABC transport system ATP-binding protein
VPASLFAFEDVVVETDGTTILQGATGEVPDEGITTIVGPSGSGKSTLLRLCNRLEVPTSGVVRFRGDDVATFDPLELRRRVGMVFQRPTPFAGSVRENLLVACPGADDSVLASYLERAVLPATFLDRRADDLSGGEQQRMCLARSMLVEPEVLLMDEPTSSLDPGATTLLERAIGDAVDGGLRVLWVTHDMAQAERLSPRRLLVDHGRIHTDG